MNLGDKMKIFGSAFFLLSLIFSGPTFAQEQQNSGSGEKPKVENEDPLYKSSIVPPRKKTVTKIFDSQEEEGPIRNPKHEFKVSFSGGMEVTHLYDSDSQFYVTDLTYAYSVLDMIQIELLIDYKDNGALKTWSKTMSLGVVLNFGSKYLGDSYFFSVGAGDVDSRTLTSMNEDPILFYYGELGKRFVLTKHLSYVLQFEYVDFEGELLPDRITFTPLRLSVLF